MWSPEPENCRNRNSYNSKIGKLLPICLTNNKRRRDYISEPCAKLGKNGKEYCGLNRSTTDLFFTNIQTDGKKLITVSIQSIAVGDILSANFQHKMRLRLGFRGGKHHTFCCLYSHRFIAGTMIFNVYMARWISRPERKTASLRYRYGICYGIWYI